LILDLAVMCWWNFDANGLHEFSYKVPICPLMVFSAVYALMELPSYGCCSMDSDVMEVLFQSHVCMLNSTQSHSLSSG
jgi:hypothetical protein